MPTLSAIDLSHNNWASAASPRVDDTGLSWAAGDYVVVACVAAAANAAFTTAPTITGLVFTSASIDVGTSASDARITIWVSNAASGSGSGVTPSMTQVGSTSFWGYGVWVVSGSSGVGATASIGGVANGATGTISLTTTAAGSTVLFVTNDWTAAATTGSTASPAGAALDADTQVASQLTAAMGHLTSAGAAGAQSYGVTGVAGSPKYTLAAIEFKAGDLTPPTAPSSLATTSIGTTTTDLSWTASSDNIAVTGYQVSVTGPG